MDGKLYLPELEQAVLGTCLVDNGKAHDVRPEWFAEPLHTQIMEAIHRRLGDGRDATVHTLSFEVKSWPNIDAVGGVSYLAKLAGASQTAGFASLVQELRDLWARRELAGELRSGLESVEHFDQFTSPHDALVKLEGAIARVASVASHRPLVESAASGIIGALEASHKARQDGGKAGTPTGLRSLDNHLGGLGSGDMLVLAGRPSMGKTAIALALAWLVAKSGRGVFFASLEMPKEQLWTRFLAAEASRTLRQPVPYFQVRTGRLTDEQMVAVAEAARNNASIPMMTGEKECRQLARLRSAARRSKQVFADAGIELGLVVVDYLQLIEGEPRMTEYQRVGAASGALKAMALDLGVPVLALSQLNRGVEARDPPVPRMSDLRESGKVEEDADVVMLVYREAYYLSKALEAPDLKHGDRIEIEAALAECRSQAQILIEKARGGPTGSVMLGYEPATNNVWSM